MDFIDWLNQHPVVTTYIVLDYSNVDDAIFLKLRIELADSSALFTKEYTDDLSRKYAFHWDNVPHFPSLVSFPHHKHDYRSGSELVTDSFDISLSEVINYIHNQLTAPTP